MPPWADLGTLEDYATTHFAVLERPETLSNSFAGPNFYNGTNETSADPKVRHHSYVGPGAIIEPGAQIGPNAVIMGEAVIAPTARIRDSLVLGGEVDGELERAVAWPPLVSCNYS